MSRESIQASAYNKVVNAINSYGYKVPVCRDIYEEDELGCKVLKESFSYIGDLVCIIDNSSSSRSKNTNNKGNGVIKGTTWATLYATYARRFILQQGGFIEYEDCVYKVLQIADTMHYHLLYTVALERVDMDGK